jgi:hypothetical protein
MLAASVGGYHSVSADAMLGTVNQHLFVGLAPPIRWGCILAAKGSIVEGLT